MATPINPPLPATFAFSSVTEPGAYINDGGPQATDAPSGMEVGNQWQLGVALIGSFVQQILQDNTNGTAWVRYSYGGAFTSWQVIPS